MVSKIESFENTTLDWSKSYLFPCLVTSVRSFQYKTLNNVLFLFVISHFVRIQKY